MSSNTATPVRNGRGMPIPGINTCGPVEKAAQPSLSFSNAWPLTPPQSAHDSRRPSLTYSSLSDRSGPSPVCAYSQPATPDQSMQASQSFLPSWADGNEVHTSMIHGLPESCSNELTQPSILGATFAPDAMCGAENGAMYTPSQTDIHHTTHSQAPASPQHGQMQYRGMRSGLKNTTLYEVAHGFGHETTPIYANLAPIHTSLEPSPFTHFDTTTASMGPSLYQPAQVVVPSQVAPQDYHMEEYTTYGPRNEESDGYNHSFASSINSYPGWEKFDHQSPPDAYFTPCEGEEGYIMVKEEGARSTLPTHGSPNSDDAPLMHHHHHHHHMRNARRRSTARRSRRTTSPNNKPWAVSSHHDIEVRFQGPKFRIDENRGAIVPTEFKDTKPHKCTFVLDPATGRLCGAGFDRSEHLKRHVGKHFPDDRKYKCPLPGCNRAIGRPDNAGDHFKTHLRPDSKGKRNKHFTFPVLEKGLLELYAQGDDVKKAEKILGNLRKWLEAEGEAEARKMLRGVVPVGAPRFWEVEEVEGYLVREYGEEITERIREKLVFCGNGGGGGAAAAPRAKM